MYVDNAYVINMEKSKDRLKTFYSQQEHLGIPIKRIDAIDGSKLTSDQLQQYCSSTCKTFCTRQQIGCFLSHRKAWQQVIINGDRRALIMEDDCVLDEDFKQEVETALKELTEVDPEWDFLYCGWFGAGDYSSLGLFSGLQAITSPKIRKTFKGQSIFIPDSPAGFHCYVISAKGAQKLLDHLDKATTHVDMAFLAVANDFIVYSTIKKLGIQLSTNENSTLSGESNFPSIPNNILSNYYDSDSISYDYYMNNSLCQIGNIPVTAYILILVFICIFIPKKHILLTSVILNTYLSYEFFKCDDYNIFYYDFIFNMILLGRLGLK